MASVQWDEAALGRVIGTSPEAVEAVTQATERIHERADSMGASHRTGKYHRDHKSPAVGNTQARYGSDVRVYDRSTVGIVFTANYSAMQDNAENNTLLKARG